MPTISAWNAAIRVSTKVFWITLIFFEKEAKNSDSGD